MNHNPKIIFFLTLVTYPCFQETMNTLWRAFNSRDHIDDTKRTSYRKKQPYRARPFGRGCRVATECFNLADARRTWRDARYVAPSPTRRPCFSYSAHLPREPQQPAPGWAHARAVLTGHYDLMSTVLWYNLKGNNSYGARTWFLKSCDVNFFLSISIKSRETINLLRSDSFLTLCRNNVMSKSLDTEIIDCKFWHNFRRLYIECIWI
jgi:hypothetical protein